MVVLTETEALAQYGFNPQEKLQSEKDFQRQLESYATHVIEDLPVSNIYSYRFSPKTQKIFTEAGSEVFIDPEERGGLSAIGTIKALQMSLANSDNLVFLYSPPGPVAFEKGTKYDKVPSYPSGQLYVFKKREEEENIVDAIALSVGKEYEDQVLGIFFGENRPRFNDEIQKIIYYLSNPELSGFRDFGELIKKLLEQPELSFYRNVHDQEFSFADVAEFLGLGIEGQIKPQNQNVFGIIKRISSDIQKIRGKIPGLFASDQVEIRDKQFDPSLAYFQVLSAYFGGSSKPLVLGGSCGGAEVEKSEIHEFLDNFNPLSTSWRISDFLKKVDSDKYGSREFECPHCHKKVRRPENILLEKCPHCQQSVRCD